MQQDSYSAPISRRAAMRLLGAGAGFGMISRGGGTGLAEGASQSARAGAAQPLSWPNGAIIRTVLNDLLPDALGTGATLVHEHLSVANWQQPAATRRRRWIQDVDLMVEEMRAARADGVVCIVDAGGTDLGRSLDDLVQISLRSGIHVVGSGGYYTQLTYPRAILEMSEDPLVEHLVEEVTQGHLGAFGEIGTSVQITPDERKMLRAVGRAHVRTGLPIITHVAGKGAEKTPLETLDIYESVGVKPQSVLSGHLDNFDDPALHAAVAKRGAFVGFDRIGADRDPAHEALQIKNIVKLIGAGYADKVLLSGDFAREPDTKRSGGPGYALPLTRFAPKLRAAGVERKTLHGILVDNPRRLLAFVPKMVPVWR